ncbi:hypothetical protein Q8791_18480 [Nocardiopsis sp. CT-R113]|uniref:Integral membrane protein n=1 Tax=Nocardiopsis codii TaxID=3065942 RepID=A0ABU7KAD3_9ACTN|nr:hypothetical protein [Nocardiopsis sp. CT-R113]MEE2039205.1 hypothetical protein [Nocardiopsis sp. CT-R113]
MKRFAGFLVGAGFGLAFVLANSGPPLPSAVALVLRVLAVAALVAIVALVVSIGRRPVGEPGPDAPRMRFDAFFAVVLVVEVVALVGGIQVLRMLDAPMQANVAWIALVVGLHFLPLARHWRTRSFAYAAATISALGLAGLVMAFTGYPEWVPFVSGVVNGAGMLAGIVVSLTASHRQAATAPVDA